MHLSYMPSMPLWLLPLVGIGFAIGNAAMEEFVFRGVIMQAIDSAFGAGWLSVIVQAWLFGVMHFLQGFPNGWWGLAMTFVYGIMLGAIRRRAQGMLAPWLAHVCADMVIFAILAAIVLGS
jgi:membrane protease YdiL (CAAX protease family)